MKGIFRAEALTAEGSAASPEFNPCRAVKVFLFESPAITLKFRPEIHPQNRTLSPLSKSNSLDSSLAGVVSGGGK